MSYAAPLKDMLFVMNELADLLSINALPGCEDATSDTVEAVLEEHGKFCSEVIAPLNHSADREPGSWQDGKVTTAKGFKEAFKAFGAAGWQGIQHPAEIGGQNLPKLVAAACMEMLNSANLSFALCPLLTDGAIEALSIAGNEEQKQTFLPNLVSGEWTGTMNLTEPQAGSDLAMVRSRAMPQADGSYRIFGTKIFITYGEHDMADNIVHLVLARTPDAPEGIKGISLFVVPKFLVNPDGSLGARNDVQCVALEHKLGIKASPTVVLQFGEQGGAVGTLVGEENRGLEYMFIMMNAARFSVGVQGIGLAERAYQKAVAYAKERVQSRDLEGSPGPVTIIHQPDVRRMLMSMRAQTEAARALAYVTAAAFDIARHHPDATVRKEKQAFYEFMVPVVKGWSTEMAVDVASAGIQVHGGMGFIEETGAAQYYRDARILTIYEGTTAIQANDLVGRKTARDGAATVRSILAQVRRTEAELGATASADLAVIRDRLAAASCALEDAAEFVVDHIQSEIKNVFAGSVPYLKLCGITLSGWQIARAALAAQRRLEEGAGDAKFFRAKISTARFYADHVMSQASALRTAIIEGSPGVLALTEEEF
ncbi:MAG: acyl-CoA dehydrogenase [Burkholderiaceae bacterium]